MDTMPPCAAVYPKQHHRNAYIDTVVKVAASEPIAPLDAESFILKDSEGNLVAARIAQIADHTWALFPNQVFLDRGKTYTARVEPLCDRSNNCMTGRLEWTFTVADIPESATGDTRPPSPPVCRGPELASSEPHANNELR